MNDVPTVSVVIITLNEEENLPRVLDALVKQTYRDFEVLVIDSNSTDRTRTVARSYASKFPRFTVHRMQRRGVCLGRNTGATLAKGRIIFFMDSDISFAPDFLARSVESMRKKRLVVAGVYMRTDSRNLLDKAYYAFLDVWFFLMQGFYPHVVGSCMIATRASHNAIGGFDETILLAEDNDYINRAHKRFRTGMLSASVACSARRFKKEGRLRMGIKYVLVFFYRVFRGEIRTDVFKYRFGHYGKDKG